MTKPFELHKTIKPSKLLGVYGRYLVRHTKPNRATRRKLAKEHAKEQEIRKIKNAGVGIEK